MFRVCTGCMFSGGNTILSLFLKVGEPLKAQEHYGRERKECKSFEDREKGCEVLSSGHDTAITKNMISQQLQEPKLGRLENGPANSPWWKRKEPWVPTFSLLNYWQLMESRVQGRHCL